MITTIYYHCLLSFSTQLAIRPRRNDAKIRTGMTSEKERFETSKFVITFWDLVDHYLLATMLAISLASLALQTTQDRLICIPAVDRSPNTTGNDSALGNPPSSSTVTLFKMPDRRHYDYVDNECYSKMDWFSAYYSCVFFAETLILLAISNFWEKYPNSANAVARCEHLVSEYNKGDFLIKASPEDLLNRLKVLLDGYNEKMRWGGVTVQYRIRGLCGSLVALVFLIVDGISYGSRHGWTRCYLDKVDYATELKGSFFQCSRTVGFYFHLIAVLFLVFLGGHLLLASGSFFWACCCLGRTPRFKKTEWTINTSTGRVLEFSGDAASLLHLLEKTGCYFVDTVIEEKKKVAKTSNGESEQLLETST